MKHWLTLSFCVAVFSACAAEPKGLPPGVAEIGRIQHPLITESSGVVMSRSDTNVFWTHNDGGGRRQVLYAISRTGQALGEFRVAGTILQDWEDLATDRKGHLYIGDIGNNDARRRELAVYEIDEPEIGKGASIAVGRHWRLLFPKAPFDCESLFVWQDNGYVISKMFNDLPAEIYRFSLTNTAAQTLESVAALKTDSPVTGASISADGELLAFVAKNGAYVCKIHGDPARAAKAKLHHVKLKGEHIEGCTFVPEGLLVTSEGREIFLFTGEEFRPKAKGK
jgi:hypothetical protein